MVADDAGSITLFEPELGVDILTLGEPRTRSQKLEYYAPPIPDAPIDVAAPATTSTQRASNQQAERDERSDRIASLAWSPDGRAIVAGMNDGRAKLWTIDGPPLESPFGPLTLPPELSAHRSKLMAERGSTLPQLHLLTCAIDSYEHRPRLRYSKAAAGKLSDTLTRVTKNLYLPGVAVHLIDSQVTPSNVTEAVNRLNRFVSEGDLVVVLLAGHGLVDEGRFFLQTSVDSTINARSGIGIDCFDKFSETRAKVLLIVETSRAGAAVDELRGRVKNSTGLHYSVENWGVLAACASNQDAQESELFDENTALGYALVQGLTGTGDANGDGTITIGELSEYVSSYVKYRLTGRTQQPVYWPGRSDLIDDQKSILSLPIAFGMAAP